MKYDYDYLTFNRNKVQFAALNRFPSWIKTRRWCCWVEIQIHFISYKQGGGGVMVWKAILIELLFKELRFRFITIILLPSWTWKWNEMQMKDRNVCTIIFSQRLVHYKCTPSTCCKNSSIIGPTSDLWSTTPHFSTLSLLSVILHTHQSAALRYCCMIVHDEQNKQHLKEVATTPICYTTVCLHVPKLK